MNGDSLLHVKGLSKTFHTAAGVVNAVRDVEFKIHAGKTLGLVGESGSGKSTTAFCVLRLIEPSSGSINFLGKELTSLSRRKLRAQRRNMQIVFQDPYSSLNPRMSAEDIVKEPLSVHRIGSRRDQYAKARELLDTVGIGRHAARKYPAAFSGGQRQRIAIARALALNPSLIVCDEAVSALDVSIQAQVVNLLRDIQAEFGLAYLFISHDLGVVRAMSDEVCVMRAGAVVEQGPAADVWARPSEAYTKALMEAVPKVEAKHA